MKQLLDSPAIYTGERQAWILRYFEGFMPSCVVNNRLKKTVVMASNRKKSSIVVASAAVFGIYIVCGDSERGCAC
ncbi:MAG: hypothetical protein K0R28_5954 [Paenibacillus sp.]|jgi:lysophospholipid acyltransferase (LPLAT)-like uncharacterized protein|nr:hypothetical protein [Paenibacillus sp.]